MLTTERCKGAQANYAYRPGCPGLPARKETRFGLMSVDSNTLIKPEITAIRIVSVVKNYDDHRHHPLYRSPPHRQLS